MDNHNGHNEHEICGNAHHFYGLMCVLKKGHQGWCSCAPIPNDMRWQNELEAAGFDRIESANDYDLG